jgi:hypothetical protein
MVVHGRYGSLVLVHGISSVQENGPSRSFTRGLIIALIMEAARISKMSVYIKDICSFVQKIYFSYFLHIKACLLQHWAHHSVFAYYS